MPKKVKVNNKPELKKKSKVKNNDAALKEKLKKRKEKKSFEEQHIRVTTYLEKPVREVFLCQWHFLNWKCLFHFGGENCKITRDYKSTDGNDENHVDLLEKVKKSEFSG